LLVSLMIAHIGWFRAHGLLGSDRRTAGDKD
jgi:hypothetical protein